jgi:ActR/RegA family two-component response regulator
MSPKLLKSKLRLSVLIFDDDECAAKQMQASFSLSGNDVVSCSTYDEFSDHLESESFDIAVFDLNDKSEEGSIHAVSVYKWCASIAKSKNNILFLLHTNSGAEAYNQAIAANKLQVMAKGKKGANFLKQVAALLSLSNDVLNYWLSNYEKNVNGVPNKVVNLSDYGRLS